MSKVKVCLHGHLGETFGAEWKLNVNSVSEAVRALSANTNREINRYLIAKDKEHVLYKVLINNNPVVIDFKSDVHIIDSLKKSELCNKYEHLERIDIVPVIEGAGSDIITLIAGVLLIVVGAFTLEFGGAVLIGIGVGLLAAGIISMLSKPPKQDDIDAPLGKGSYLLNGPSNTIREGGPVPIGYGRLLVGSQVIAETYKITERKYLETPIE